MRLKISHTTEYLYEEPVAYALQRLRLHPQSSHVQTVLNWSLSVEGAKVEAGYNDQFGNRVDLVSIEGGEHTIRIIATGEVETIDRAGVLGPHHGFVPLWLYLRETERTKPGKLIKELARSVTGDSELAQMHAMMELIHANVEYKPGSSSSETTAEQALEAKAGVCQDHAHIFVSAARFLKLPARYVSGYLMMEDRIEQTATHAWAEVHIPGLGWVGFDAANKICPDERYVRIASGLCYSDAAPVSGMRIGSAGENLTVTLSVEGPGQSQSQSQSSDQGGTQSQNQSQS
ncbi:transglutaminase family protein [Rhizobium lemnae]|uniref:Transglutaminase domain-containing protein n=1 Tax=Rhizobium lemnae TaxID=1214924 RepID=A0ABV8EGB0_9HYPH|nr:transglutaminase family protein [Rhizobium lemnae]MCJ8509401.1 transglutaminase family protein [Rhizobium lemnae]